MDSQKASTPLLDLATRRKNTKLVQVVQNFFTKTLQVIVQARLVPETKTVPYEATESQISTGSGSSKINKWFNLHMASLDSEWVKQELRPWKLHVDLSQFPPMIIETYLDLRQLGPCEIVLLEDDHGGLWPVVESSHKKLEVVLERWLVEFDQSVTTTMASSHLTSTSGSTAAPEELPLVYKQAIVLLRVIYGIVRLLPAYKLKKRVGKLANKNLSVRNRFIDGKQPVNSKGRIGLSKSIVPHQMLLTDSHMTQREFAPIHTSLGTLRVSVAYRNHYKFNAQDHEERLSNHFILSDNERARGSQDPQRGGSNVSPSAIAPEVKKEAVKKTEPHAVSSTSPMSSATGASRAGQRRGSFGHFREKYSVLPCTSEVQEKEGTPPRPVARKHGLVSNAPPSTSRPSIQPFKVGSIGSSSSPPYGTLASVQTSGAGSSMERRISITSNRSGSNASLVALLRNPRGSTSSSNAPNAPNAVAIANTPQSTTNGIPRSYSSSHGSHTHTEEHNPESVSNTPRFSSSFGSRQSRRFSNTSVKYTTSNSDANALYGTSVELTSSSVPFSGLYADDDISSFVQMIDGTSELRLSSSNHESKAGTPNNDSTTHFDALNRFQLLKSHYQHLSDSVSASLVLQHNQSRSPLDDKLVTRKSSRSTNSPAPSLPVGSFEHSHMPSINSRLSKFGDELAQKSSDIRTPYQPGYPGTPVGNLVAMPLTVTTIAHASHRPSSGSKEAISGLATTPSVYESAKQAIKYEDVFEEDDEGVDYFASVHGSKHVSHDPDLSFDADDMLFEMTDTK